MTVIDARSSGALAAEVPRAAFIPDTIWVAGSCGDGLVALSQHTDPEGWQAAVSADAPVITQVNLGDVQPGQKGSFASSSASQPSIVAEMLNALDARPGQAVLEIGTGTGWNAALLSRCVGEHGRVVTIDVDPRLARHARRALAHAGYHPLVITGDGLVGYPAGALYDRVISTASIREVVPRAWLDQLRPTGRLVTPWGTDWSNGVMLTLTLVEDGVATGRFSGDVAFMRLRGQRRARYGWRPSESDIERASISTTSCRGSDLDRMLNPEQGTFAIGARLASCCLVVEWDARGALHHRLELDDGATRSWAQLDANLNDPAPFTVRQLGPRKLWDEAEAAYDWWHDQGEPRLDQFGLRSQDGKQWIWLDEPDNTPCRGAVKRGSWRPAGPGGLGRECRCRAERTNVAEWGGVPIGSLYRELHLMAEEGLIAAVLNEQLGRRPARTIYEITDAGREALSVLRERAVREFTHPADPVGVALLFAGGLTAAEWAELLAPRRRHITAVLASLAEERERHTAHGRLPPLAIAAFRRGEL